MGETGRCGQRWGQWLTQTSEQDPGREGEKITHKKYMINDSDPPSLESGNYDAFHWKTAWNIIQH